MNSSRKQEKKRKTCQRYWNVQRKRKEAGTTPSADHNIATFILGDQTSLLEGWAMIGAQCCAPGLGTVARPTQSSSKSSLAGPTLGRWAA